MKFACILTFIIIKTRMWTKKIIIQINMDEKKS
jgi:hypothetical protein